jgi:hypothetical protein
MRLSLEMQAFGVPDAGCIRIRLAWSAVLGRDAGPVIIDTVYDDATTCTTT